jgi:hypothetical protein
MTETIDHDTCSQLLRPYLAGEAGDDAPAIAEHLDHCAQCRAELDGLRMLLTPVEGLSSGERELLHAGIDRATRSTSGSTLRAVPVPSTTPAAGRPPQRPPSLARQRSRTRTSRRLAPALSAAAAIVLIASGIALFQHQGTGSGSSAKQVTAARGAAQRAQSSSKAPAANGFDRNGPTSLPLPRFAPAAVPSPAVAETQAASMLPAFADAYSGTQAHRLAANFLQRLSNAAPEALSAQVATCGHSVLNLRTAATLPAYGALARVGGQRALVLVFATSSPPAARLTRLDLVAWPVGSCDHQLLHRSAAIGR